MGGRFCRSAGGLRPRLAQDDSGQRVPRPDRHSRPHAGRRGGAAQGQPRRPRLVVAPARRQARRPAADPARLSLVSPKPKVSEGGPALHRHAHRGVALSKGTPSGGPRCSPPPSSAASRATRWASRGSDRSRTDQSGGLPDPRADRRVGALAQAASQGRVQRDRRGHDARRLIQGYVQYDTERELGLRGDLEKSVRLAKADVEELKEQGTLMPDGLAEAMSPAAARPGLLPDDARDTPATPRPAA